MNIYLLWAICTHRGGAKNLIKIEHLLNSNFNRHNTNKGQMSIYIVYINKNRGKYTLPTYGLVHLHIAYL